MQKGTQETQRTEGYGINIKGTQEGTVAQTVTHEPELTENWETCPQEREDVRRRGTGELEVQVSAGGAELCMRGHI